MSSDDKPARTLVLGGVKSGKSAYAALLAHSHASNTGAELVLIATATALDQEMTDRINRHKIERDDSWRVVEEPLALASTISTITQNAKTNSVGTCIVIDCLTLWITNLLLADDQYRLEQEVASFIQAVNTCQVPLLMVSNETNMGITPLGDLSRRFCDETGLLHQQLAKSCEHVVLMVAGLPVSVKG